MPGTNPFFMWDDALQGNRLLELLDTLDYDFGVYLMSTGRVGGGEDQPGSKKVKIPHSSAIVKGIAEGTIEWVEDPDFGYLVAASVPGIDAEDEDLLRPRELYSKQGRGEEFDRLVDNLKAERREYMAQYPQLAPAIIEALG